MPPVENPLPGASRLYADLRRSSMPRACPLKLVGRGRRFQIYLPPLALHNSLTNLGCSLTLLLLRVGVVQLLQTDVAARAMRVLEAAMQAVMSHSIAVAIAGLLMQHCRYLRSQIVRVRLIGKLGILSPQLLFAEDGRKLGALRRRAGIVSRDHPFLLGRGPGRRHSQGKQEEKSQCQSALPHNPIPRSQIL